MPATSKLRELDVPAAAVFDEKATELVRVWAVAGEQHVSLATGVWDDPAAWGILLVDLARHVARAYAQTTNVSSDAALRRIREGFEAEWSSATDTGTGSVVS